MEELPYEDGKPVDSELQDLIAHLLKSILAYIWAYRNDWFFGIDMGWYYRGHRQERQARRLAEGQAEEQRQLAEELAAKLRELGVDPDRLE